MDFKKIVATALLLVFSNLSQAARVDSLYQAEITVPNEQVGTPDAAQISKGLQQVLIKVTGRSDLIGNPTVGAQLKVSEDYLQQFSYQSVSASEGGSAQVLILDFSSIAVNGLVNHAGLKPLGEQRPTILLWLADNRAGEQQFLGQESEAISDFKAAAKRRGLPVQLPIFDLEDQVALPVSDLWGLFETSITKASARYLPEAVLAARIQVSENGFNQIEWILIDGQTVHRRSTAGALEQVVPEIINAAADQLFSPMSAPVRYDLSHYQTGIAVNISNVTEFSDYTLITDYLRALPVVKVMKPETVSGSDITLRLELDGTIEQLKQAMGLDPRLQVQDLTYSADGSQILHYYWQE